MNLAHRIYLGMKGLGDCVPAYLAADPSSPDTCGPDGVTPIGGAGGPQVQGNQLVGPQGANVYGPLAPGQGAVPQTQAYTPQQIAAASGSSGGGGASAPAAAPATPAPAPQPQGSFLSGSVFGVPVWLLVAGLGVAGVIGLRGKKR